MTIETYTTPDAAKLDPNKLEVSNLLLEAHAPGPGEIQFVLQRNPSDHENRDSSRSNFGSLDTGATEREVLQARDYLDKALMGLSEEDKKHVKVLVFGSPSSLTLPTGERSDYQRAIDGAAAAFDGFALALDEHGLSPEQILNASGNDIYSPQSLVDLKILTESPDYVDFLVDRAKELEKQTEWAEKGKKWNQIFWILYEDDTFKDEREEMSAEGPADIAERMRFHLNLVNNSLGYLFDDDPEARVIVWNVGMYDNIQPFLEQITGEWHGIEHGAGVAIDVGRDGQSTVVVGGKKYDLTIKGGTDGATPTN